MIYGDAEKERGRQQKGGRNERDNVGTLKRGKGDSRREVRGAKEGNGRLGMWMVVLLTR